MDYVLILVYVLMYGVAVVVSAKNMYATERLIRLKTRCTRLLSQCEREAYTRTPEITSATKSRQTLEQIADPKPVLLVATTHWGN